jgi:hypothetical protein
MGLTERFRKNLIGGIPEQEHLQMRSMINGIMAAPVPAKEIITIK